MNFNLIKKPILTKKINIIFTIELLDSPYTIQEMEDKIRIAKNSHRFEGLSNFTVDLLRICGCSMWDNAEFEIKELK